MRFHRGIRRLCAAALLLCAGGSQAQAAPEDVVAGIQAEIEALKKKGTVTANPGSLAIESWLLTSTAIDSTAATIQEAVKSHAKTRRVLVVAGSEELDFSRAAMMQLEIEALTERLAAVCQCRGPTGRRPIGINAVPPVIPMFGAIAGLLKSDTELTAIEQSVDAKLLAAAVAVRLNAILPSTAVTADPRGKLISAFDKLVKQADEAQSVLDRLSAIASPTPAQSAQKAKLGALLERYGAFYDRVTTANAAGAVPLIVAARLQNLSNGDTYILRVNTEKAGGTLVKRTNVLTALGAESVFISAGLVSSYQLTDPATGEVRRAGVITCRTTLTTLKRVQSGSWKNSQSPHTAKALCLPSPA